MDQNGCGWTFRGHARKNKHTNTTILLSIKGGCEESIIERLNQVLTEVSLLRSTVQQLRTQYQVSVDALHIRARVLEQTLQLLSTRLGRAEESRTVAEHSFAHLQGRVSVVESQLQLDALD